MPVEAKDLKAAEGEDLMIPLVNQNTTSVAQVEPKKKDLDTTDETECGFSFIRGRFCQRLATQNVFAFVFGLLGFIFAAASAYSNGAITTMEKRFKIPSKTIGIVAVGNDISQVFASMLLSYYAGKGHRPRWIAFGAFTIVTFCLLTSLPHFFYGPGEDALSLTIEYADQLNQTSDVIDKETTKKLCVPNGDGFQCEESENHMGTVMILFLAQFIAGIGGTLFYSVGTAYMDDNVHRDKTAALLSFSFFLRTLGVAGGYALASVCLSLYISPTLSPTIDRHDPRWLGAWWLGWLILASVITILGFFVSLFPNVLPKAAARKAAALERARFKSLNGADNQQPAEPDRPASIPDMIVALKRLMTNRTLLCINASSIFMSFGYTPYWVYMPKYIETQYRQSASFSNLITGTAGLLFSAAGILVTGIVVTKYKPSARCMALWNIIVGSATVLGATAYIYLGCSENESYSILETGLCNANCNCEYVPYSPICSSGRTFISACHAGCNSFTIGEKGAKTYTNCSCIPPAYADPEIKANWTLISSPGWENGGDAKPGSCPKDCANVFLAFLSVVCLLKFIGATGRATNFLVSVRCVADKDKPLSMGLSITLLSIFSFVPAPIFYGHLMDTSCLVWGKTCSSKGNCWLYDDDAMRFLINIISAVFLTIGVLFDVGVWFYVKGMPIFDEESQPQKDKSRTEFGEDENRVWRRHSKE